MSQLYSSDDKLVQLASMVLVDFHNHFYLSKKFNNKAVEDIVDAVYPFAHTKDNKASVIDAILHFHVFYDQINIAILNRGKIFFKGKESIWEGQPDFNKNLIEGGWLEMHTGIDAWKAEIAKEVLKYCDHTGGSLTFIPTEIPIEIMAHTHTEAIALVDLMVKKAWSRVIVISPQWHILRAFMETTSEVIRRKLPIRVYAYSVGQDWFGVAQNSASDPPAPRCEAFEGELRRLHAYHTKGELCSVDEVLEYLKWRDS